MNCKQVLQFVRGGRIMSYMEATTKKISNGHYTLGSYHIIASGLTDSQHRGGFDVNLGGTLRYHTQRKSDAIIWVQQQFSSPSNVGEFGMEPSYSGPCDIHVSHCEQCGRPAEGSYDNDGYSSCCNELIVWDDCRNHHNEVY